jgi:ABC-type lipoprotein release transport system permease subunit
MRNNRTRRPQYGARCRHRAVRTLSYRVTRRTPEIGIRMALGASRDHVVWMVVRDSLGVCLAGMALGVPLAFAGSRFLESMPFGRSTRDPWSYAGALGAVTLLAGVASLVPARRAVSVDPMIALRSESRLLLSTGPHLEREPPISKGGGKLKPAPG